MNVDKEYCMSSFLMYRTIADRNKQFSEKVIPNLYTDIAEKTAIKDSNDLEKALETQIKMCTKDGKAALALSGGIDSAVLAKFMPEGSTVYTFKCIVPGIKVIDETVAAAKYAKECGLIHNIIEIHWEDFEKFAPILMLHKGAPIHSIEVQIYKACLKAKEDGFERIIFGESADLNYGGLSGLMSKDWKIGEFIDRYSYVKPYHVLKNPVSVYEPIKQYENDGYINVHEFCRGFFLEEAMGSYSNACQTAGIELVTPYVTTRLEAPLDLQRIRKGENKYLIREVFNRLYNDFETPVKTPMPRPTNEWLINWKGPSRPEFYPHCTDEMTGDQKWLVMAMEIFLNMLESGYINENK